LLDLRSRDQATCDRPGDSPDRPGAQDAGIGPPGHCERWRARSAEQRSNGASTAPSHVAIARAPKAAPSGAPSTTRIEGVIVSLLLGSFGRARSAGFVLTASPAQPVVSDAGYRCTWEACAAGISAAVPRAMPRTAASVRNMVFIVGLLVDRGACKHGGLGRQFVCRLIDRQRARFIPSSRPPSYLPSHRHDRALSPGTRPGDRPAILIAPTSTPPHVGSYFVPIRYGPETVTSQNAARNPIEAGKVSHAGAWYRFTVKLTGATASGRGSGRLLSRAVSARVGSLVAPRSKQDSNADK